MRSEVRHRLQQFGGAALLLQVEPSFLHSTECLTVVEFQVEWSKGEEGELAVLCSALQRPRRPAGGSAVQMLADPSTPSNGK